MIGAEMGKCFTLLTLHRPLKSHLGKIFSRTSLKALWRVRSLSLTFLPSLHLPVHRSHHLQRLLLGEYYTQVFYSSGPLTVPFLLQSSYGKMVIIQPILFLLCKKLNPIIFVFIINDLINNISA